jgi:hypothetical protein
MPMFVQKRAHVHLCFLFLMKCQDFLLKKRTIQSDNNAKHTHTHTQTHTHRQTHTHTHTHTHTQKAFSEIPGFAINTKTDRDRANRHKEGRPRQRREETRGLNASSDTNTNTHAHTESPTAWPGSSSRCLCVPLLKPGALVQESFVRGREKAATQRGQGRNDASVLVVRVAAVPCPKSVNGWRAVRSWRSSPPARPGWPWLGARDQTSWRKREKGGGEL